MHVDLDIHLTTLVIAIGAAVCTQHVVAAAVTWRLAKRKRRLFLPYALFGLVGLIVLALRSPAYAAFARQAHPPRRIGYTHTGFSGPVPDGEPEVPARKRKRSSPLAEYHVPQGAAAQRAR